MATQLVEVNLSEEHARRSERKASRVHMPKSVGAILVGAVLLMAGFHLFVYFREQGYNQAETELAELAEPSAAAEELQQQLLDLQAQVAELGDWVSNQVIWARTWRALSQLLPDEAFLTSVELDATAARGTDPRLILGGRTQGEAGESVVLSFIDGLESDAAFNSVFGSVILSSIRTESGEKVFTIEMTR
jgi:hypothetical protein